MTDSSANFSLERKTKINERDKEAVTLMSSTRKKQNKKKKHEYVSFMGTLGLS